MLKRAESISQLMESDVNHNSVQNEVSHLDNELEEFNNLCQRNKVLLQDGHYNTKKNHLFYKPISKYLVSRPEHWRGCKILTSVSKLRNHLHQMLITLLKIVIKISERKVPRDFVRHSNLIVHHSNPNKKLPKVKPKWRSTKNLLDPKKPPPHQMPNR